MDTPTQPNPIAVLLHLEQRAQLMRTVPELGFVMVNETWQLLRYRQAVLFVANEGERPRLSNISNLAALAEDSPFTVWLKRLGAHLWKDIRRSDGKPEVKAGVKAGVKADTKTAGQPDAGQRPLRAIAGTGLPASLAQGWTEWMPEHVFVLVLTDVGGGCRGFLLLACDQDVTDNDRALVERIGATYAYCLGALTQRNPGLFTRLRRSLRSPWRKLVLLAIVAGVMMLPVRLSVLAPAEIVALKATAIAAPLDGVVKAFQVEPNQTVKRDQALFTLDDTTLRNRRDVAQQALSVARADALRATQKAFDNAQSKSELAALDGQVREKQAELAWLDEMLGRVQVRAPRDGVVVFGDSNDWIGKPVATGERIALLADEDDAGVLVWLPAADAINLEPGADIRLFLHIAPLSPLQAQLTETSYQATLSPDNVAAYRIRARLTGDQDHIARIGLKGTAKVYGPHVMLIYYLLRRPLSAIREWSGL